MEDKKEEEEVEEKELHLSEKYMGVSENRLNP